MEYLYVIGAGLLVGALVAARIHLIPWIVFGAAFFIGPWSPMFPPPLDKAHWALTMLYLWIWLILAVRTSLGKVERSLFPVPLPLNFFFLFLFCAALGSAYSMQPAEIVAAGKYYFQEWAIPFLIFLLVGSEKTVRALALAFLALALLQPAFAGLQQLALSGRAFSGDWIGGSFGTRAGGGAILSLFLLTQLVVVLTLVRHGILRIWQGVAAVLWISVPLLWTHAKAIVLMLPVGVLAVYLRDLRSRPAAAAAGLVFAMLGTAVIAYSYFSVAEQYRTNPEYAPETFSEFVEGSLNYAILDTGKMELNRGTAVAHWFTMHSFARNPLETLVGHGIGSAKEGGVVVGHLHAHPEYGRPGMDYTALSRLLWEVGIVGAIAFTGIFVSAILAAGRLSKSQTIPAFHRAILAGYQAALTIMLVALLWKDYLVDSVFGALAGFIIGYILYWYARDRDAIPDR